MWVSGEYPKLFMADVIAFHNLKAMVSNHTEAEMAKAAKRGSRIK